MLVKDPLLVETVHFVHKAHAPACVLVLQTAELALTLHDLALLRAEAFDLVGKLLFFLLQIARSISLSLSVLVEGDLGYLVRLTVAFRDFFNEFTLLFVYFLHFFVEEITVFVELH